MHTQGNGQTRIVIYGKDNITGWLVPVIVTSGAINVNVVGFTPTLSTASTVTVAAAATTAPMQLNDDTTKLRINSLSVQSTDAAVNYVKIFTNRAVAPTVGDTPDLQYILRANADLQIAFDEATAYQGGVYVAVERTIGNYADNGFAAGVAVISVSSNAYV